MPHYFLTCGLRKGLCGGLGSNVGVRFFNSYYYCLSSFVNNSNDTVVDVVGVDALDITSVVTTAMLLLLLPLLLPP